VKALRDLTFLCALLLGLFWLTTEPKPTSVITSELIAEQIAKPQAGDAWLPLSPSIQIGSKHQLPTFESLPGFVAKKGHWTVTDAFAPVNAFGQALAHACASEQRMRLLFPFHEFS
jgi:hypothetical protein